MQAITVLMAILAQAQLADPNKFNHFLLLGYAVMWAIAMIYVLTLANRQRNAREEVKLLRRLLEEDEKDSSG